MCGINGFLSFSDPVTKREEVVARMNHDLAHRGPDSAGIWSGQSVTLGHRRLSIIDLSEACNQPFYSNDGRYVLVYNGELYNFQELRLELQRAEYGKDSTPYFFKTQSDTEVILAAYIRWGEKCLERFNGMYAFAVYDNQTSKLFIGRDRLGVKPLYYHYGNNGLIFSSEIRPILRSGIRQFSLNRDVLAEYSMFQTVLAPNTIVKGVQVLLPGHYLTFEDGKLVSTRYYELTINPSAQQHLSYSETCTRVFELLTQSVQRRLVADVPFGAFLSGGIDSSIVVGLMSRLSASRVKTFHVSFDESEFSEAKYAKLIAEKFGTEHHEIRLRPQDFLRQLPEALSAMDHPGGDGPNTYVVSKATKNAGITMALSGIGGDELFAGYDVFKRMEMLRRRGWINAVPHPLRRVAGLLKKGKTASSLKVAELLSEPSINFQSAYPLTRTLFTKEEQRRLLSHGDAFTTINEIVRAVPQRENFLLSAVSLAEIKSYLQQVLLRDADQMGMAVALEIREPFLDYQLMEFVLNVRDSYKYPSTPKKLLVDAVGDLLPPEIVNRPKMGFTLPWNHWMRSDLKEFSYQNLLELSKRDLFETGSVMKLWERFLAHDERVSWSRLWHLIILNNWIKENNLSN